MVYCDLVCLSLRRDHQSMRSWFLSDTGDILPLLLPHKAISRADGDLSPSCTVVSNHVHCFCFVLNVVTYFAICWMRDLSCSYHNLMVQNSSGWVVCLRLPSIYIKQHLKLLHLLSTL